MLETLLFKATGFLTAEKEAAGLCVRACVRVCVRPREAQIRSFGMLSRPWLETLARQLQPSGGASFLE